MAAVILIGVIPVNAVQIVAVFLRQIEHVAVGIVAAISGERTLRWTFDDTGVWMRRFHAILDRFDGIHDHAEMVEATHIPIAMGQKIETHRAIAGGSAKHELAARVFRSLQAE